MTPGARGRPGNAPWKSRPTKGREVNNRACLMNKPVGTTNGEFGTGKASQSLSRHASGYYWGT